MHLHSHLPAVGHYGYVARNYGRYARLQSSIDYLTDKRNILIVHDRVQGQIALYAASFTILRNLPQIIHRKPAGAAGAHIQTLHPEIDGAGTGLKCRCKRFP